MRDTHSRCLLLCVVVGWLLGGCWEGNVSVVVCGVCVCGWEGVTYRFFFLE